MEGVKPRFKKLIRGIHLARRFCVGETTVDGNLKSLMVTEAHAETPYAPRLAFSPATLDEHFQVSVLCRGGGLSPHAARRLPGSRQN